VAKRYELLRRFVTQHGAGRLDGIRKLSLIVASCVALGSVNAQDRSTEQGAQQTNSPPVTQMPADAIPSFEVASIKPTDPSNRSRGFHIKGHRVFIENQDVNTLISVAYAIHPRQIIDAPTWFGTDKYDINGITDIAGTPNLRQLQEMIQKLLADRFQLKVDHERRELSVYAITVAKGGPKLEKSAGASNSLPDQTGNGRGTVRFKNNSMSDFALGMQEYLERPVVDQTGLAGRFDFVLNWAPDDSQATDPNAPSLFTAVQEQLGLKFVSTKAPADVVAIVHAEHPSED
jgi:uncharacterized protein (TIGR03435 family)